MSGERWEVQYNERAEELLVLGLNGAADDITTLVDGLLHYERVCPPGSVVLTPEQVAQVRADARAFLNRFTEPAFCRPPLHNAAVSLAHSVLALLDDTKEDTARCTCPVGSYNSGNVHEPYCDLATREGKHGS